MRKLLFALGISLLAGVGQANATPSPSSTETFTFVGKCSDCSGTGNATLVLSDYTLGTDLLNSNFVSFSYAGTNLQSAFIVTSSDISYFFGKINAALPGYENVYLQTSSITFQSINNGQWCVGPDCGSDQGSLGTWSEAITPAPEPAAIALVGSSVLGLAAARRRRAQ